MENTIKYKKFVTKFSTNGVSEPVIDKLFGKYDGHIENGQKCQLQWNKKHTRLENAKPLPAKTVDRIFSPQSNVKVKIFHYKGAKYRYTKPGFNWTLYNGRLNLHTKWLRKNPGANCRWMPI